MKPRKRNDITTGTEEEGGFQLFPQLVPFFFQNQCLNPNPKLCDVCNKDSPTINVL